MRQALKVITLGVAVTTATARGQQENGMPSEQARELTEMVFFLDLKTDAPGRIAISPDPKAEPDTVADIGLIDQIRGILDPAPKADAVGKFELINRIRQKLDYAPLDFRAMPEADANQVINHIRWELSNFTKATNQIERLEQKNLQLQEKGYPPIDFAVEIPRSIVSGIRNVVADFSETGPVDRLRKLMASPYKPSYLESMADAKARQDGTRVTRDMTTAKTGKILLYAKENNIPLETVVDEAKATARQSRNALEAGGALRPDKEQRVCESMLHLLAEAGGMSSLPFIEEMSGMDNEGVRFSAVMAHMNLAGIDSLRFIRQAAADERYAKMNWHTVYARFFQLIHQKKQDASKDAKWDELCAFLLGRVQDERHSHIAESLDRFLCDGLPDYSNSVQRLSVARRFVESDVPNGKTYFVKANETIDKTPADKRTDLSKRFKLAPAPE